MGPVSPKARLLMGVLTTVMFLGVGTMLILEERLVLGAIVVVLGALRGLLTVRQARAD